MGVVIVSINGLKAVNTALGNSFGDSIVQQTAEIMKTTLDTDIYRIGGDEFISLHPDLSADTFEKTVDNLRNTFSMNQACSVSIGVSWSDHDIDVHELASLADQQLNQNKKAALTAAP